MTTAGNKVSKKAFQKLRAKSEDKVVRERKAAKQAAARAKYQRNAA